jgi:hypothetical protein
MGFLQALNPLGFAVFFLTFWAVLGIAVWVVIAIRNEE